MRSGLLICLSVSVSLSLPVSLSTDSKAGKDRGMFVCLSTFLLSLSLSISVSLYLCLSLSFSLSVYVFASVSHALALSFAATHSLILPICLLPPIWPSVPLMRRMSQFHGDVSVSLFVGLQVCAAVGRSAFGIASHRKPLPTTCRTSIRASTLGFG